VQDVEAVDSLTGAVPAIGKLAEGAAVTGTFRANTLREQGRPFCRTELPVTGFYPENSVQFWELETGRELCNLAGNRAQTGGADFSPDGRLLLTGGGNFVRGGGTSLRICDVTAGKELRLMS